MLLNTPQYDSGVLQKWLPQEMRLRTHLVAVAPFVEIPNGVSLNFEAQLDRSRLNSALT